MDNNFEIKENPALQYVINRWGKVGNNLVIEGTITEITSRWEFKRAGRSGHEYDNDSVSGFARLEPSNLKCDIIIDKPDAEIADTSDDIAIVGAVLKRFGTEICLQTYDLLVKHNERAYMLKPKRVESTGKLPDSNKLPDKEGDVL